MQVTWTELKTQDLKSRKKENRQLFTKPIEKNSQTNFKD